MPPKRPSLSEGEIIKEGILIKSPPPSYLGRRWRKRLFVLRKCLGDDYTLSYYSQDRMSEEQKGSINISEISKVDKGSDCPREELASTLKLYKCSPGQVLVIRTIKRTYFLVTDQAEEEIDSWHNCLSPILEGSENTFNPDNIRPNSYPSDHPNSGTVMDQETQRQRSRTDPSIPIFSFQPNDLSRTFYAPPSPLQQAELSLRTLGLSDPPRRLSLDVNGDPVCFCSCSKHLHCGKEPMPPPDYDSDLGSDDGSIYDTPRRIQQRYSGHSDSSDPQEISEIDPESDDVYEQMCSIVTRNTKNEEKPQDEAPPPEHKTGQATRTESRELSQMDLLRMKYEWVGTDGLQKKEVTVPTEHLQKYLDVEELGESLYIRRWNGPKETGCLFRHGDHIDIVNEFRVKSRDVFLQMLNNSVQSTVKLVIISNPRAPLFHANNCQCGAS
ncbi:pleckstrin homology domain-containing family S member 1 isoform X2 [Xenopus laevis]|nr:pleckstrin homology domain-containing family S member 1 isoform X2 [Xenopus laevis]XP_041426741.1 pleckstrin homology domain-containing family S member 1 isoform X2 [Xenopus laevis]